MWLSREKKIASSTNIPQKRLYIRVTHICDAESFSIIRVKLSLKVVEVLNLHKERERERDREWCSNLIAQKHNLRVIFPNVVRGKRGRLGISISS